MADTNPGSVLVTGAAGFVGRAVARALAAREWRVTGLDRVVPADATAAGSPYTDFWGGDVLDDKALAALAPAKPFDAIVHLVGLVPSLRPSRADLFAVNVGGTSAVLARFGSPGTHLVFFSTGLVYGAQPGPFSEQTPLLAVDPYAQSKLAAEALIGAWSRNTRSPAAILRPSIIYGAGAPAGMLLVSLMQSLRRGEPFPTTGGEQLRDFVHVDDVAEAVALAVARRAEGSWNVAAGETLMVRDAAQLAARIAGRPDLLRIGALPYRPDEVFDYRFDAGAIDRDLGWRPRIALAAGLERLWRETP